MSSQLIKPSKSLGYSDIYLEFVQSNVRATEFYLARSAEEVATQIDQTTYDRELMVSILTRQNRAFHASDDVFKNIALLADPKTLCLFAGQQAGLFGGPMFTIIKAMAIVKEAREQSLKLNRPVIPIFWIAGDDHDFEEANHTYLLDRQSEPTRISYPTAPEDELPVARICFEDRDAINRAKEEYRDCLGKTEFTRELYDLLDDAYAPGESFVTAFGRLVARLTGDFGLVQFCPTDDEVKKLAAPFFGRILNQQSDILNLITKTNQRLTEQGFHIQVEKKATSTHLFYYSDGRKPLVREGGHYRVGESQFTKDELEALLKSNPERFSPDVMTRPLLQSFLFPTLAQKCGPSEIAYLAQINPLFATFNLPVPLHQARPTVTMVEARHQKVMTEWKLGFEDLVGDIEQVVNRILAESFPPELEEHFQQLREEVESHFDRFINESLQFDQSLKKIGHQIYGKIDFNLKAFEQKVFAAHKKHSSTTRAKIYRLWHALYPRQGFQERTVNVGYFIARYGFGFVEFLYDQLDSQQSDHQLIQLSEKKQS